MAHHNNTTSTPPSYHNPYPAWPPPPPVPPPQIAPYTTPQPTRAPYIAQTPAMQNVALPPELQNLNLTPQQLALLFTHFQAQTGSPLPPPPPPPPPQFTTEQVPAYPAVNLVPPFPQAPGARPIQDSSRTVQQGEPQADYLAHLTSSQATPQDREEGELSDAGQRPLPKQQPASGSKKRKLSAPHSDERLVSQRSADYSGTQLNGHGHPRPDDNPQGHVPATFAQEQPIHQSSGQQLSRKKEVALPFVAALHQEGFTFDDLVREGLDHSLLRGTYAELNIPIDAAGPNKAQVDTKLPNVASVQDTATPVVSSKPESSETAKPPTAPATKVATSAPPDRQSYLARLQAAKNKKSSAPSPKVSASTAAPPASVTVKAAAPGPEPSTKPSARAQPQSTNNATTTPSAPGKDQTPSKVSDAATELVRKKMEALKSMKRHMAPRPPVASPTPPTAAPTAQNDTTDTRSGPVSKAGQNDGGSLPLQASTVATPPSTVQSPGTPQPVLASGGIPGLFMSAAASTSHAGSNRSDSPAVPAIAAASQSDQHPAVVKENGTLPTRTISASQSATKSRRRPLAAELNEAQTPPEASLYKRPFGRSRQNSSDGAMIIEVSDDEGAAGDDEMTTLGTRSPALQGSSSLRQKSIRDLPPLRDFPQRSASNKSGIIQGNATPVGTPGASSDVEELKRKEQEINALQVKIKEYERRKKALKAKAHLAQTRPETPPAPQSANVPQSTSLTPMGASSVSLPGLSTSVPGLGAVNAEPSTTRHSKLKDDITASDAALSDRRSQMAELQRQMAELQQQCDDEERNKQALRDELEGLDIDTKGMSHTEMKARKDEIDKQTQEVESENSQGPMIIDSGDASTFSAEEVNSPAVAESTNGAKHTSHLFAESSSEEGQLSDKSLPFIDRTTAVHLGNSAHVDSQATTVDDNLPSSMKVKNATTASEQQTSPEEDDHDDGSSMSESSEDGDAPVESARLFVGNLPFSMTSAELSTLFSDFNVQSIDLRLRGKKPAGFAFVSLPQAQAVSAIDRLNNVVVKDRRLAVQMARPAQSATVTQSEDPASVAERSSSDAEMNISETSSDESDDVSQPAQGFAQEASLDPTTESLSVDASKVNTPAEDDEADDSEMDLDSSDSEADNDEDDDDDVYEPAPAEVSDETPVVSTTGSEQPQQSISVDESIANDISEPQNENQQQLESAAHHSAPTISFPKYTPYESPLKAFKKYRFHPDYLRNVSGGYHSLTYSHRIDPNLPLCRFEFAGGICRDQSCDGQHWRDMVLSDDQLLIQLGTGQANPAKTKEDIARYNVGLKGIIQQLRQEETSDTESVGTRIAQHRRQFIGDPTVVVTQ